MKAARITRGREFLPSRHRRGILRCRRALQPQLPSQPQGKRNMNKSALVTVALALALLANHALAAPQFVPGPQARYGHSMAYDTQRHVVVLFGGNTNGQWPAGALGDTWEWDGDVWMQRAPTTSPGPRGHGAMAYDSVRGVSVFFGGYNGGNLAETWEWDGANWTQRTSVGAPGARRHFSMVYDSARQVVVLFGGYNGSYLGDTWEYDGSSWVNRSVAGPSPRQSHDMAYDAGSGQVVLFGGSTFGNFDDTWCWDGTAWTQQLPATNPPARSSHALCYHAGVGRVVMFAGSSGPNPGRNDTWLWDGVDWVEATPIVRPAQRLWTLDTLVYDADRGECLVFGGYTPAALGDTWTFDGAEWRPQLDYVMSPINGHRYAKTPLMTWASAEALAALGGGHLATVRSQAEQDWIVQTYQPTVGGNLWIGLSDQAQEGVWVWSSGEELLYEDWCPGEPNDYMGAQDFGNIGVCAAGSWDDGGVELLAGVIELPAIHHATYMPFGSGCAGPTGVVPSLSSVADGVPQIGTTSYLRCADLPLAVTVPIFILGFSNTYAVGPAGGYPLPQDLAPLGWPGCPQLVTLDDTTFAITTSGSVDYAVAVPSLPFLAGVQFHVQALVLYTPTGVAVTNGVTGTAGW